MRIFSFYLPQYHPIPENDEWWGKGFTEWTYVASARPLFRGHYQPHIPADLGFYDLRLEESRIAQAELAAQYGIGGFCYYHYWFNGRMLLERPFNEVLERGTPGFPFLLCWANGNWTRRWDGREREVLMRQDYEAYDAEEHFRWLCRAFADSRYATLDGRPIFLVYDAAAIPGVAHVIGRWRETAHREGIADPYVVAVLSPGMPLAYRQLRENGFDGVVDFYPKGYRPLNPILDKELFRAGIGWLRRSRDRIRDYLPQRSRPGVQSFKAVVKGAMASDLASEDLFPCVFPSWDNTPRRGRRATIIQNNDPGIYREWLKHAARSVMKRPEAKRIVFINAWNEWGEGCHLEPDIRNGRSFLEATAMGLREIQSSVG